MQLRRPYANIVPFVSDYDQWNKVTGKPLHQSFDKTQISHHGMKIGNSMIILQTNGRMGINGIDTE